MFPKIFRPPFKLGLRTQLTILVCIIALSSLIILGVMTCVYFTMNYDAVIGERLHLSAQLKASQVDTTLSLLYHQCNMLSATEPIKNTLLKYRVVNNRSSVDWTQAEDVLSGYLTTSNTTYAIRLYDSAFNRVLSLTNTASSIPDKLLSVLLPLDSNDPLPSTIHDNALLVNPVRNDSMQYLMSISIPVFSTVSIITKSRDIAGYMTVVMSADVIKSMIHEATGLDKSKALLVSRVADPAGNSSSYEVLFPNELSNEHPPNGKYQIRSDSFLYDGFNERKGGVRTKGTSFLGSKVAVGYSPSSFFLVDWVAIIRQPIDEFSAPVVKLAKILTVTVIAVAVFVCILTFIITNWAVKPIVRLQKATEQIAAGRGLRSSTNESRNSSQSNFMMLTNSKSSYSGRRCSTPQVTTPRVSNSSGYTPGQCNAGIFRSMVEGNGYHENKFIPCEAQQSMPSSYDVSENYNISNRWTEARIPFYRRLFSDELSELTDTFNTMTDELDRYYALLEDRVRARTKQLEAAKIEAEEANEAKTVFIANISHELRTPLNGILGMTAIAMAEKDMEKVGNSLKLIFRSGELLLHILTELLTFSKNVMKRTKLEERNFSMIEVALQTKSIFGKLAVDQHVSFSIYLMPNVIRSMVLWGDSNRIIQIVMNLVSNALKFTPVDGKVLVKIKIVGEYDEERSKACEFSEVYIKPGTEITDECVVYSGRREIPKESEPVVITNNEKIVQNDVSTDSDTFSIGSFSSSDSSLYEDLPFHFQFKQENNIDSEDEDATSIEKVENPKTWVFAIEVEDTGPGIDPSLHDSIFKPFVQGDQTLSRQHGGTGLGLSICRQLATMMNGTMKLDNDVRKGCKFTFTVPLRQTGNVSFNEKESKFDDEFNVESKKNRKITFNIDKSNDSSGQLSKSPDRKKSGEFRSSHGTNETSSLRTDRPFLQSTGTAISTRSVSTVASLKTNTKVLIAEDNNVNQEVIKRMLFLEGNFDVDLVCDGQEALDKVKELMKSGGHYAIIFMDIQMPKVDGLLATKQIRNELNYKHPIVALTAFADDSNIKECLDAGMNDFLSKPIKRPMLKKILTKYSKIK
ncbi:HHR237Wp [Eremothecium sinecaudum]|uniref:histidine kinase n=1 Tax=Eremothecium sinecaudum TaxID=45286 RepID=A0A0X8HWI3_9SACH|nr:HHR237Wp [Eremothecium sinecaudum]AMD23006.1 HHR237Wp [Eremothecium sinecaudum]